jgi:serine/threonine protein kinase
MEYCQGGDLSNFIRSRRTIPEKYVRKFIQQIGKLIITIQIKFFNNHYFI